MTIKYPQKLVPISKHLNNLKINHRVTCYNDIFSGNLVEINSNNSKIIEYLIINGTDTSKVYVTKAQQYYINNKDINNMVKSLKSYTKSEVNTLISLINEDNSTFDKALSTGRDISGIEFFTDFICKDISSFIKCLDKPNDKSIVDKMVEDYKKHGGYNAKSFASKICKYICEFELKKYNFYIRDKIVSSLIPYYLKKYCFPKPIPNFDTIESLSYVDFYSLLDYINSASKSSLNKSEIDHIIWYSYKSWDVGKKKKSGKYLKAHKKRVNKSSIFVVNKLELENNFNELDKLLLSNLEYEVKFAKDRIRNGKKYIYKDGKFYPSKWSGYKGNSLNKHTTDKKRNGGLTDLFIENILGEFHEDLELDNEYRDYCIKNGIKPTKRKRKFVKF